jgi:hypothetical protein
MAKGRRRTGDDVLPSDSPWKEALQQFLEPFLAFFFPRIHAGLDWRRGYQALDKEFQQIVKEATKGRPWPTSSSGCGARTVGRPGS